MAIIQTNSLLRGMSGMFGNAVVFKNLRGKTIAAKCPVRPVRQSAQQQQNRSRFRDASQWAKQILLDAERKAYYLKKAKKLKLPNAYTAAIADYMRPVFVQKVKESNKAVTYHVVKAGFAVQAVSVTQHDGASTTIRNIAKDVYGYMFSVTHEALQANVRVEVKHGGRCSLLEVRG